MEADLGHEKGESSHHDRRDQSALEGGEHPNLDADPGEGIDLRVSRNARGVLGELESGPEALVV